MSSERRIRRIDGGKMFSKRLNRTRIAIVWLTLMALLAMPLSLVAQTRIQYHNNKFSVQDDVKLGRQAAQEAEQQFPLLRDENARAYVERVGQRLVSAIPPEFQHREFQYYFKIIMRVTSTPSHCRADRCM
jgi:predicted Zn-dependent protease